MIKLSEILSEKSPCWKGYKQIGMKEKDGKQVPNCVPINELSTNDIHYKNIMKHYDEDAPDMVAKITLAVTGRAEATREELMKELSEMGREDILEIEEELGISELNENKVDYYIDKNGDQFQTIDVNYLQYPGRVTVKYAGSEPVEYKGNFEADLKSGIISRLNSEINEAFFIGEDDIDEYDVENEQDIKEFIEFMREYQQYLAEAQCDCVMEAEYHGRKVQLGKPMQGDIKKFKVYVKNNKGKVVKVNFGAHGMNIKKNNPVRRKAYRARHHCDNPGPRTKANYWSCRKW